jgi:hypothetical protein
MYLIYATIAVFLITIFTLYVYIKKPSYGIALAVSAIFFIALAVFWNVTEESRSIESAEKISLTQLKLSQQSLQPAYGNHYLYKAKLENQSVSSELISIQLQLSLADEQMTKWLKVWLAPEKSKNIDVYFTSVELAKAVKDGQWKVLAVASKARN